MKTLEQHNTEVRLKRALPKKSRAGVICGHMCCPEEMVYVSDNDMHEKYRGVECPLGHKQGVKES